MKIKNKKANSKAKQTAAQGLRELFIGSLKDMYWAEIELTKALPEMANNAANIHLISTLYDHLEVTEKQVTRLEDVFANLGEKSVAKKCDAMEGLLKESESIMEETEPGAVRDAGIIAASQKMEHYKIASYGTMAAFAATIGESDAAEMLWKTAEEGKEADVTLTKIAYNAINFDEVTDDEVYIGNF